MSKESLMKLFLALMTCIFSGVSYSVGHHIIDKTTDAPSFIPLIIIGVTAALTTLLVMNVYISSLEK